MFFIMIILKIRKIGKFRTIYRCDEGIRSGVSFITIAYFNSVVKAVKAKMNFSLSVIYCNTSAVQIGEDEWRREWGSFKWVWGAGGDVS